MMLSIKQGENIKEVLITFSVDNDKSGSISINHRLPVSIKQCATLHRRNGLDLQLFIRFVYVLQLAIYVHFSTDAAAQLYLYLLLN